MNQKIKYAALGIALACTGWTGASAEQVYELNPITVTAQRMETTDLKTPAAVEVLTADDIQKTGATSVHEALKFSTGIVMHAQGPRNISQGTMTNKAVIRGVEKGTLVLVDGVPINQGGRYNLEDIPTESIDRIEIVRGGGAVLYGSEAAGGVINIITKGTRPNMIKAGIGNYGIQNYAASAQAGKLGITYSYDHTGKIDKISAPTPTGRGMSPRGLYYNIIRGEHSNVNWRYNFNDKLFFTHTYGENSDHYRYKYNGIDAPENAGKAFKDALHSTKENLAQLHYDDGTLKANIYYNRRDQKTINYTPLTSPAESNYNPDVRSRDETKYLDESYGLDTSNRWTFDKGSFMLGFNYQKDKEKLSKSATPRRNYDRDVYSFYGQLAYDFTKATRANLNLRETWTGKDDAGNNYSKFTPEFIIMHDFDSNTMVYGKVGKSFMLPTFSQLYGGNNVVGVPGLKPQSGTHYELGFKKNIGTQSWRLAVYNYKIKDSLEAKTFDNYEHVYYSNGDIRNTGIELDWANKPTENLTYHLGLSYSHPEKQSTSVSQVGRGKNKHVVTTKGDWNDYYGRVGFNAGISYKRGKLTSSYEMSVLGDRTRDAAPYNHFKDQCFTDLNFSYQANKDARFFLNIDNLFNRHDIVSSSSSSFYNLGRNFMAGVEYKF